jgi:hypothetical protein
MGNVEVRPDRSSEAELIALSLSRERSSLAIQKEVLRSLATRSMVPSLPGMLGDPDGS